MSYKVIRKYNSNIHLYTFNPEEERLSLELGKRGKLEKPSTIGTPKSDEVIAARTNAGFFNFNANPEHLGLLIADRLYYSPPSNSFIDLIFWKDKKFEIKKVKNNLQELNYLQANSIFACGSSFSLIQNGVIDLENCGFFNHYINREPRTAIGQKKNGFIVMCVVDGRSKISAGVTGKQLAQIMLNEGCVNAVNFDGGGSSVMVINNKVVSKPSGGYERSVGSVFVVYKKRNTSTNPSAPSYPTIKKGSKGEYVKTMQKLLNQKGFNSGTEDGIAGNITISALKEFQKKNGLVIDGICGVLSWSELLK